MSSVSAARAKILADLDREFRVSSGLGVVFSQAVATRLGITGSDLECLDFIGLCGGVASAGQLAEATGLTTGAVTGMIDRLEKAGFAKRDRDPDDRRKVLVRLLPAAEKRIKPIYASMQQSMQELLAPYTEEQLSFLLEFMAKASRIMVEEVGRLRSKPQTKKT